MKKNQTKKNKNSKKNNQPKKKSQTKKNNVKKCMETFVENKIKDWTADIDKEIEKLNKKNLTDAEKKQRTELKIKKKNYITSIKKQYKLYNCNIDCKNTLLEPGPPDQIPKSMREEYHNNEKLIEIFNNQRKKIFNNKTNVLVDHFYEKTPEHVKKQLIKEGAISQCVPTM